MTAPFHITFYQTSQKFFFVFVKIRLIQVTVRTNVRAIRVGWYLKPKEITGDLDGTS